MRLSSKTLLFAATLLALAAAPRAALATAEVCGNGIDDNANGYADEGCESNATMGVCPSAMNCKTTGDVGPKTGYLAYQLPADFKPTVAYGPALTFARIYASGYAPPATNYRTAMGERWMHNWQSWLDKSGTTVIVHLVTGRDVLFTYDHTTSGFDYYKAQAGFHMTWLRQATTSPNHWQLKTLTGETYEYDWTSPVGKLVSVWDTLATPNKITIVYFTSGGNLGQINTITDAIGHKRFVFGYTSGLVTSVQYQTGSAGTWTLRTTLAITYTGTDPTTLSIGATQFETNAYTSNYLTSVQDASSNHVVDINYVSGSPGKVANVTTGDGGIGYDYASANSQCVGQTVQFFNIANATACNVDTDCGGTNKCGGKTGSGATGKCYRAARCMTTTSPSEDLVTTVTAITPCTGVCAPTAQYSWNTTTLDLKGQKLGDGNWTSYARDTNGMVIQMAEGDSDDDPTNGGGIDTWMFYGNASFPGRMTEKRRQSNIDKGTCNGTTTTGCSRTQYTWNSDGLLATREDDGFTYNASNAEVPFVVGSGYITSYFYDTKGRLTQIDGPLSGSNDVTNFGYWSSSDTLKDGYLNTIQRKKDTTNFVTTTLDVYDTWGNSGTTIDPDGTPTCRTWDNKRNYLSQIREAMAGQADCTTSNAADLTTSFVRDSWLRLTKTTNPFGDCVHMEYDASGRLTNTKVRDDCVVTNAGNTSTRYYDSNGLLYKSEMLDASSNVTRRTQRTFLDGMQLDGIINTANPSYSRNFTYYSDAQTDVTTFENGLGKTEQFWDVQNRENKRARYTDSVNHNDWTFGFPASPSRQANLVTDPAAKNVTTDFDDLGRKNHLVSPDSGTTLYVYDAASRLVTIVEGYGSVDQVTHSFTYDNIGRRLTEDYGSESCSGSNPVEVQYTYDALPSGVMCPAGATCTNLNGRLAYVKEVLMCTSTSPFHLDQEDFYGYDAAGRLTSEELDDPSPRSAQQNYTWDKNGNLTQVTAPSAASMTYTYGSTGNSDANLVTTLARTVSGTPTNLLTGILWEPFGPVMQYDQANTIGGNAIRATLSWNLAYRATQIKYATTLVNATTINFTEDEKGRYTQKLYSNVFSGVQSDYLQYDWYDRPTCDATASGTCPTSGATLKTNVARFNSSNDRTQFYHQGTPYGDQSYAPAYNTGADTINNIARAATSSQINYGWDGRGNRTFDNDTVSTSNERDYTYDGRRRVRTITGHYNRVGCNGLCYVTTPYTITYAYDHRDRMVFRQFSDTGTSPFSSQLFYYYDLNDRLIEVKYVSNISNPSTYTIYDFYWLGQRPVAQYAVSFPGSTTSRYFMHADEANRVLEMYDWPSSGDASDAWAVNPDAFGWDAVQTGFVLYQPLRLNDALYDDGTISVNSGTSWNRPGLLVGSGVHYDPLSETVVQRVGQWPDESYALGSHSPAIETWSGMRARPSGDYTTGCSGGVVIGDVQCFFDITLCKFRHSESGGGAGYGNSSGGSDTPDGKGTGGDAYGTVGGAGNGGNPNCTIQDMHNGKCTMPP